MQTRACPCGVEFKVADWELRSGRGKYCSKPCKYRHQTRPTGLKYKITTINKGWIKPGQHLAPEQEFKKGQVACGTPIQRGQRLSPDTEFAKGTVPHNFGRYKPDAGYTALHDWVKRRRGKASKCGQCGSTRNVQWSNVSFEYKRDLNDWQELCASCHRKHDMANGWGRASEKFPNISRRVA